jgi:AcrR family transcriptional regulator
MEPRRLGREERRERILQAVVPVFARKGFHGATSRELAEACGVSEALLYRHFRDKPSLYAAVAQRHVRDGSLHPGLPRLKALPPSTQRLVLAVQYLLAHFLEGTGDEIPRLMVQSLLGDGEFAHAVLEALEAEAGTFYRESVEAAARAGDLQVTVEELRQGMLLTHHLAFAVRLFAMPQGSQVDAEAAARFALRGLGLRPEALERCYRPGAWKELR